MVLSVDRVSHDDLRHAQSLEQRARDMLEQHSHFRGRASLFQYECSVDVLIVRGIVPTFYLKQLLQSALKGLEVRIDNQVVVAGHVTLSAIDLEPANV